jgi:hypothetical protein
MVEIFHFLQTESNWVGYNRKTHFPETTVKSELNQSEMLDQRFQPDILTKSEALLLI